MTVPASQHEPDQIAEPHEIRAERMLHEAARRGERVAGPPSGPAGDASHDPAAARAFRAAREEVLAMQSAADTFTSRFDFETARRAITERRKLHRRAGLGMGAAISMIAAASIGLGFWKDNGDLVVWSVALPGAPLALWWIATAAAAHRERRLLRTKGDAVLGELFGASRRRVLQEFELVRACVVLTCLGLLVLVADALVRGANARALIAVGSLGVLMAITIPRVFGKRARRRAEAFASGELSAEAFAEGRDGPALRERERGDASGDDRHPDGDENA